MTSTLVQLVNAAQTELGLFPVATTVASAIDDTTIQLLGLINLVGRDLMVAKDWTLLESEGIVNVAPPLITTGNLTAGNPQITGLASIAGITANTWVVTGQNVPQAARIVSVDTSSRVTMNEQPSASSTGATLTFSQDTFAVPADYRHPINRTTWDRSRRWELLGPTSPQEDQWMRSGIAATGPRRRFRITGRGSSIFRIWPPPSASDTPSTLVFNYISQNWATSAAGVPKAAFTADTDTCVFPDDVMITGLKMRFFQVKGFDVSTFGADFARARDIAMAQDGGSATIGMGRRRWPVLLSGANIPDSNFPSSP